MFALSLTRIVAVAAATIAALASPAGAQMLTATPGTLQTGDTTTVTFAAQIDSTVTSIGGFDFILSFDPLFSYVANSFSLGSTLSGWNETVGPDPAGLVISLANLAGLNDPDTGGATLPLFSLQLTANSASTGPTTIALSLPGFAVGVDGEFQVADQSVQVSVTQPVIVPMPAPASALLLLPALIALGLRPRRAC